MLFPKPPYRVKESEGARDYQEEPGQIEGYLLTLEETMRSAAWFKKELELQRLYERETGIDATPALALTTVGRAVD